MSTRSLIARQTTNGYEAIYCHHDGYTRHMGPILTGHYTTEDKLQALLNLGDLSCLAPEIGKKHDFKTHGQVPGEENWCLAYGRDRGRRGAAKRFLATEDALIDEAHRSCAEYLYLFRDGTWVYRKLTENQAEWQRCQAA